MQSQLQQLGAAIQDRDRTITDLIQNKQQLLAQLKDFENRIASLESDQLPLEAQLHDLQLKEQDWSTKREQLLISLNDKERNIKELIGRMQTAQLNLKESEESKTRFQDKNKVLFKDNKLFKQKVDSYARNLAQVALLKDRLLKENAVLHYNLGVFYLQRQEYNEAITELEKVLELNPNDAATHYNLGLIYADYIGNKNKALIHFKRYLALDPKDKDADRAKKYILTWETWQDEKIEPH